MTHAGVGARAWSSARAAAGALGRHAEMAVGAAAAALCPPLPQPPRVVVSRGVKAVAEAGVTEKCTPCSGWCGNDGQRG